MTMDREQESFVSRRAMLPIAAGALASAAVIPAVAAQSSEIVVTIEAHRRAYDAFEEACTTEAERPKMRPSTPPLKAPGQHWRKWKRRPS
ncbi:MAG: hypothetical protein NVS2B5_05830 [Beijerinckiaceae bacterium]